MKMKNIKRFFLIYYVLLAVCVLSLLVLHYLNLIQKIEFPEVTLIVLLAALPLLPFVKSIDYKDIHVATEMQLENATENDEDEIEEKSENENELKKPSEIKELIFNNYKNEQNLGQLYENQRIKDINDEINNYSPIFFKVAFSHNKNIFFDVRYQQSKRDYYNRLYVMLAKIKKYSEVNNKKCELNLLFADTGNDINEIQEIEKIKSEFQPALEHSLLKITEVKIDSKELYNN